MPFGLKNAGPTYQRMMTKMFEPQLGKSIEVYINDMVVKSKMVSEHVGDLGNIFEILRKHKLCLNASKCSFGVGSGKFLGYMVTHRGIEVNPNHIKAINNLQISRNPKEFQKLTGITAALNWFISRLVDRCRTFFLLINKWKGFEWTEECASAFQQLKEYLSSTYHVQSWDRWSSIYLYRCGPSCCEFGIDMSRQRHTTANLPCEQVITEVEVCYLPLEKAILVVLHGTRKLPHYFQAHTVVVLT